MACYSSTTARTEWPTVQTDRSKKMKYSTFQIAIETINGNLKFFEFLAVDHHAAVADVKAIYGDDVEIFSICLM